jgi:hypothetical protein|nr:MAG TPA: hypothetical protein [Caudoviricetes sp.]
METVLGVLVGLVLIGGFAAFIGLVFKNNGHGRQGYQGYQPNKPLEGNPPRNARSSVQNPVWEQRNKARLAIDQNYFYYDGFPIGVVDDDKPYAWCIRILKSQCKTYYNPKTGKLEVLPVCGQTEDRT